MNERNAHYGLLLGLNDSWEVVEVDPMRRLVEIQSVIGAATGLAGLSARLFAGGLGCGALLATSGFDAV
ncbi:MAG: hypothetical protein ACK6DS_16280 [Planctomycetota bacterium]